MIYRIICLNNEDFIPVVVKKYMTEDIKKPLLLSMLAGQVVSNLFDKEVYSGAKIQVKDDNGINVVGLEYLGSGLTIEEHLKKTKKFAQWNEEMTKRLEKSHLEGNKSGVVKSYVSDYLKEEAQKIILRRARISVEFRGEITKLTSDKYYYEENHVQECWKLDLKDVDHIIWSTGMEPTKPNVVIPLAKKRIWIDHICKDRDGTDISHIHVVQQRAKVVDASPNYQERARFISRGPLEDTKCTAAILRYSDGSKAMLVGKVITPFKNVEFRVKDRHFVEYEASIQVVSMAIAANFKSVLERQPLLPLIADCVHTTSASFWRLKEKYVCDPNCTRIPDRLASMASGISFSGDSKIPWTRLARKMNIYDLANYMGTTIFLDMPCNRNMFGYMVCLLVELYISVYRIENNTGMNGGNGGRTLVTHSLDSYKIFFQSMKEDLGKMRTKYGRCYSADHIEAFVNNPIKFDRTVSLEQLQLENDEVKDYINGAFGMLSGKIRRNRDLECLHVYYSS